MDFYELAIRTGRNVAPSLFMNWFTGGLNFQIEHHMFPTVPRHNLQFIAKDVQRICKKHNIPYHTTSFYSGLGEIFSSLEDISTKASTLVREE
jgi:fatty acid desaturase